MSYKLPPLSLYIHIPWCIKKCPYCDFNSHELKRDLTGTEIESQYISRLLQDLREHREHISGRTLRSIFIGGGTPSLFSASSIAKLLDSIHTVLPFPKDLEITLEANPGIIDQKQFLGFRKAGINRLSIGVQSFQDDKLKILGRAHNSSDAQKAVAIALKAGITNFNIDLMFGLPSQTIDQALQDLAMAQVLSPTHISWYQLTIEPHTAFYHSPPILPNDEIIWKMQKQGQKFLSEHQYKQYEISAYKQKNYSCKHNVNYWEFGDYIGIGAGAHSKITDLKTNTIFRSWKTKNPRDYLNLDLPLVAEQKTIAKNELAFEFMLNTLRLNKKIPAKLFTERTGLLIQDIQEKIKLAQEQKLLVFNAHKKIFYTTKKGKLFLNNLLELFI